MIMVDLSSICIPVSEHVMKACYNLMCQDFSRYDFFDKHPSDTNWNVKTIINLGNTLAKLARNINHITFEIAVYIHAVFNGTIGM